MRVHREDLGTVAYTVAVAANYCSHVCRPCVLAYITVRLARVLCEG